jgi:hypothetical protein
MKRSVARWTGLSEEVIASIFTIQDWSKQEARMKQATSRAAMFAAYFIFVSSFDYLWSVVTDSTYFSETLVYFRQTSRHYVPKDVSLEVLGFSSDDVIY